MRRKTPMPSIGAWASVLTPAACRALVKPWESDESFVDLVYVEPVGSEDLVLLALKKQLS